MVVGQAKSVSVFWFHSHANVLGSEYVFKGEEQKLLQGLRRIAFDH